MKSILLATDYSPASVNAADYAAQFALKTNTKLIVFHAWMVPVYAGEASMIAYPVGDLEEIKNKQISKEADRIQKKWGVKAVTFQTVGFAADEISEYGESSNAGLVVMGMRHLGPLQRVFGSVTTAFIRRNKLPLLVIPENVEFKFPKKILFTTDLESKSGWNELNFLKDLITVVKAEIHVMNAVPDKLEHMEVDKNSSAHSLEKLLHDYSPTWHYEVNGDVLTSIYKVAEAIQADWIAAVHHKRSWLQRMIGSSTTKQLAFTANIPLLILPENSTNQ